MSASTCSNSKPRVSTRSVVSAQYMNASSGSGLCPTRIRTRRDASNVNVAGGGRTDRLPPLGGKTAAYRGDPGQYARDVKARRRRTKRLDKGTRSPAGGV